MASKAVKGKKVVNQEELRRLMREQKRAGERQKRVESPYAKYNSLGHLSCALCNAPIKSDILWNAHVLGKAHKDRVAQLKAPPLKRKAPDSDVTEARGGGGGASASGVAGGARAAQPARPAPTGQSSGLGLLAGQYDDDDDDDDEEEKTGGKGASEDTGLPADFFDSGIPQAPSASHSGSISKPEEEKVVERKENTAEALPEGFFDDPLKDAKVRNVDTPKDLMDKEWEEFQKEMRQVNSASDAIVAVDDEEGRIERQIDEIDEQIEQYRRMERLLEKFETVKGKCAKVRKTEEEPEPSGSDEEDEEELLHVLSRDWRAKGALT